MPQDAASESFLIFGYKGAWVCRMPTVVGLAREPGRRAGNRFQGLDCSFVFSSSRSFSRRDVLLLVGRDDLGGACPPARLSAFIRTSAREQRRARVDVPPARSGIGARAR
jgi:hypothetical protein